MAAANQQPAPTTVTTHPIPPNYPFATAEDDALAHAAALAHATERATERAQRLLDEPSVPRDALHLRTLAWQRHCQGVSTQDIAGELDVPDRTVRSWLAATRDELASDLAAMRQTHLLLAVDSLRQLLATTWELLEAERDATLPLLESLALPGAERHALTSRPSHAPRYLTAALAIQKELNRLLALSTASLTTPAAPPMPAPPTPTPTAKIENPAEMATPPTTAASPKAAKTATPTPTTRHANPSATRSSPPPHHQPRRQSTSSHPRRGPQRTPILLPRASTFPQTTSAAPHIAPAPPDKRRGLSQTA